MVNRSGFLTQLIASIAIGKLPVSITKNFRKIYLLQCFVAGFRHYEGMQLLENMREVDLLELVREPENEYDDCAITLQLQGKKIGFIPASVNEMLSYLLDSDAMSHFCCNNSFGAAFSNLVKCCYSGLFHTRSEQRVASTCQLFNKDRSGKLPYIK